MSDHLLISNDHARAKQNRLIRIAAMRSRATFTPSPRKHARISTRGQPHPSWHTKRWTEARRPEWAGGHA